MTVSFVISSDSDKNYIEKLDEYSHLTSRYKFSPLHFENLLEVT
ncbi:MULTISPECIES: hypothetical protein [Empedobacter]|nr:MULTISPECIES: hypothetical protein [Empedobacter]